MTIYIVLLIGCLSGCLLTTLNYLRLGPDKILGSLAIIHWLILGAVLYHTLLRMLGLSG